MSEPTPTLMLPELQVRAIAGVEKWQVIQQDDGLFLLFNKEKQVASYNWETEDGAWQHFMIAHGGNRLLTSRDAIISVIEKLTNDKCWSSNPADYPRWQFSSHLLKILGIKLWDNGSPLKAPFEIGWLIIKATPEQLREALLKSLNLWT